jgi:hypothetical protein
MLLARFLLSIELVSGPWHSFETEPILNFVDFVGQRRALFFSWSSCVGALPQVKQGHAGISFGQV